MPTFHLYKAQGETFGKADELVGASKDKLLHLIEKHAAKAA
jgi:hypothetical protein